MDTTNITIIERHSGDGNWAEIARVPYNQGIYYDFPLIKKRTYYYRTKHVNGDQESDWTETSIYYDYKLKAIGILTYNKIMGITPRKIIGVIA